MNRGARSECRLPPDHAYAAGPVDPLILSDSDLAKGKYELKGIDTLASSVANSFARLDPET